MKPGISMTRTDNSSGNVATLSPIDVGSQTSVNQRGFVSGNDVTKNSGPSFSLLTSNFDRAGIAHLAMRFDFNSARADGKIVRQPEDHLKKVHVRDRPDVFGGYVVALVLAIDQIDDD